MIYLHKTMNLFGLDLNVEAQNRRFLRISAQGSYASGQARFFADHDLSAIDHFSAVRCDASGRTQGQEFFLSGSILRYGIRSTDVSRIPARHRSQSAGASAPVVSHGVSLRDHFSQYTVERERHASVANLCRLCATPDCDGATTVRRRTDGYRFGCHCVCIRCNHNRSVFVGASMGAVSLHQSRNQVAYVARFARFDPDLYSYHRRQDPRSQYFGRSGYRTRRVLPDGSGLPRFQTTSSPSRVECVLCDPRQEQYKIQAPLFPSGRSGQHQSHLRPDWRAAVVLRKQGLSKHVAARCRQRRQRQTPHLFDQQFCTQTGTDRRALQTALASRIVLQMDQTTFAHQIFSGDQRKRRQNPNMDCRRHICSYRHREKTVAFASQPL